MRFPGTLKLLLSALRAARCVAIAVIILLLPNAPSHALRIVVVLSSHEMRAIIS